MRPILVVEDDDDARQLVVDALSDAGHPGVAAGDGVEGLERVRRYGASLILLDLAMPHMDGAAFMAAYGALPGPHAPVVVCTAHPQPVLEARRIGATDFLRKPFVLRELLAVAGVHADAMATSGRDSTAGAA